MDLIDSREVAEMLGVSTSTVNRRALAGEIPTVTRTGGRRGVRLFDRREIEQLAAGERAADDALDETRAAS
jgi:predicted DNA-binding transcriptional regulator AlpA